MSQPFCDDLRVSFTHETWDYIREEIGSVLSDSGFGPDFTSDSAQSWRSGGGTVRSERMGRVRVLSASGTALATLRIAQQFGRYLSTMAGLPHKVTGLHATLDVRESAPDALERILIRSESEDGLRAGRKRIPPQKLERWMKRRDDGRDTGSVYCGGKGSEIRPVVYDKRQERLDKGCPDLGYELTRYELRTRSIGATLGDAYDPSNLFFHYMAPDFLAAPVGQSDWSPGGEGFVAPPLSPTLPAVRLLRRVEASSDFADIARLAGRFPGGLEYLCHLVRSYGSQPVDGVQGPAPAGTVLGEATPGSLIVNAASSLQ